MEFRLKGIKTLGDYEVKRNEEMLQEVEDGTRAQEDYDQCKYEEKEISISIQDGDKTGTLLIQNDYNSMVRISVDDLKRILKTM